jgi:hypothetical protein
MTCSKCRKARAVVKLKGTVICADCLIQAVYNGVPGANRIAAEILHRRAAKSRLQESQGSGRMKIEITRDEAKVLIRALSSLSLVRPEYNERLFQISTKFMDILEPDLLPPSMPEWWKPK